MLKIGAGAVQIELADVNGELHMLGNKLTLAIFFKTNCPTCQYAWPFYERLRQAYQDAGLHVWGISQHDRERTRQYQTQYGANFLHLIDAKLQISRQFDPEFVPTGFLIDEDRTIVAIFASWNREQLNDLAQQIATRLHVPPKQIIKSSENVIAFKPG